MRDIGRFVRGWPPIIALMALKSVVNRLSPGALSNITPRTCEERSLAAIMNHKSRSQTSLHPHLERRTGSLHREADVLIQKRAAVAEDMEEYRVFVQPLVSDHL